MQSLMAPAPAVTPAVMPAPSRAESGAAAPAVVADTPPKPAVPAAKPRRDAAFLEEQENRLRTLKRLRDADLISEEEYQRKRREVLDLL